ncbi:MAG: alpha/beta fold hydrolase, partial [Microbacterium sp.]
CCAKPVVPCAQSITGQLPPPEAGVASGLVVTPASGGGNWPVIDWAHGTTGFAQQCAPSLLSEPFESGALFIAPDVVDRGWAIVATDYLGLGTAGPHPYLIGVPSAHAVLDARRAAAQLEEARLGEQTVVWGHSQGGGAALWSGALADAYAPELDLAGVVALAPASSPPALIGGVADVTGGSIFASFAIAAYTAIYDDVTYREYVRPGLEPIVRTLAGRCLSEPGTVVSILTSLGLSADPEIFSTDPTSGPLGGRLSENIPPATVSAPLLIGQGGADDLVTPTAQSAFVDGWCADGQSLDYTVYPGLGHLALVEPGSPAIDDVFAWTAARFAGEPALTGCHRVEP